MSALALLQDAKSTAEVRLPLWGDLALADPVFLVLVPLAAAAIAIGARRRHAAAKVPVLPAGLPPSLGQRLAWLPPVLKGAALVLFVLAMARPLRGNVELTRRGEGVDIALVLDRSSSMEAREAVDAPRRFDVCKRVLADFAQRRMTDTVGAADNVALLGFARFTDLLVPFTLDADALKGVLDGLDIEVRNQMDGTGIGVALARAVQVLREMDSSSRIVVLLTDGEENVNLIAPLDAAMMAAEEHIKVYTVFVGPKVAWGRGPLGRVRKTFDTTVLERIAELTEARFFHAVDETELEQVYAEIESLERREREESRFAEHFDLYPRLLVPALLLYALAWIGACTWARRVP